MSRIQKIAVHSAIGAIIGFCLVSILVLVFFETRFRSDAISVLGIGGLIGGAVCGAIFSPVNAKTLSIVVGGVGGIGGCILFAFGTLVYAATPWPSPKPYPNVEVDNHTGAGSWGLFQTQVYTVTIPLNDVQQHYDAQMQKYCETPWEYETFNDDEKYTEVTA